MDRIGRLPLPPYITHPAGAEDEGRYQTVFRAEDGEAVAAPTAGLHFTDELIDGLKAAAACGSPVRLHVGLGTFRPMTAEDLAGPRHARGALRDPRGHRRGPGAGAGAGGPGRCWPWAPPACGPWKPPGTAPTLKRGGSTRLFIQPGYRLRTADLLLTNFHLPESTLFVLVSALLGLEFAQAAYCGGDPGAVPVLQLRRRDADPQRPGSGLKYP